MTNILFNRAVERDSPNPDNYIKTAFDEILGVIYNSATNESMDTKLIEEMAYYAINKLEIKEEVFNWQRIEDFYSNETYLLASHYLNFSEVIQIMSKAKVSDKEGWEDIKSSIISVDRIGNKIISTFKENITDSIFVYSIEELRKTFENKK